MKLIFLSFLLSLPIWAISPETSVQQLNEINNSSDQVICAENEAKKDVDNLYNPIDALKDINAGNLTFMGREIFPGSGQNYTCVYRSDNAYILYNNCMASKKESQATDIEVIAFNGDIASFYVLNKTNHLPVSALPRADYDMSWRVSATESPPVSNKLTVADLKKHREKYSAVSGGCSIGSTFKAQDMDSKAFCIGGINNPEWKVEAENFWKAPSDDWYTTLKKLRKVVEGSKF